MFILLLRRLVVLVILRRGWRGCVAALTAEVMAAVVVTVWFNKADVRGHCGAGK